MSALISAPSVGLSDQKRQSDMVESVIAQAMRDGAADLTAFEVMTAIERVYGERLWPGTVSRAVANLVAAGRVLQDKTNRRPSAGSKALSARLTVPVRQVEAFY